MRFGRKLRSVAVDEKKTKPCFVRLEKVKEERPEVQERTPPKKLTGPLKKRPINTSQISKELDDTPTTVASTRSRRAPKPNPKYSNADIITPKLRSKRRGADHFESGAGESDSADEYYNALEETSEGTGSHGPGEEHFHFENYSDFSENGELLNKPKKPIRSSNVTSTSGVIPPQPAKRGRPRLRPLPSPTPMRAMDPKRQTPTPSNMQLYKRRKLAVDENKSEPPESIIARNKRLNIALYDSNVSRSGPSPKPGSLQQPHSSISSSLKRPVRDSRSPDIGSKAAQREKSQSPTKSKEAGSNGTQDDLEAMPTFTIVNINDIINKKGDSLTQKNTEEVEEPPVEVPSRVNRRKSGHTTILSDKPDLDKIKAAPPTYPVFPPRKPKILNSIPARAQERKIIPVRTAQQIEKKPAPRILNSVVAKKTQPVQPILSKITNDMDLDLDLPADPPEKSPVAKENVAVNKPLRKLPPEKVFIHRQGNKVIKKITCFETWYVISIPEVQEPIVKNTLEIPLISLGNAAKSIKLPSSAWSSKVTLYRISNQFMARNYTTYIGDLTEQSIPEEDRSKYQPSCVMFRRTTQNKSRTRMPYDRAVIFKMKTFFTNIDGKNVRLIGAPSSINTFEDVEVLLELIDELDLLHEFVEPANTV